MELLNCRFANRVVGGQWESKLVTYIRKYSMSNKSSIVTSAADGCGKPSSIRPMDNLPSRDHKGALHEGTIGQAGSPHHKGFPPFGLCQNRSHSGPST